MDIGAIIAIVLSAATAAGALIGYRATARKTDLEILRGIIAELREANQVLEKRVGELELENRQLRRRNERLEKRVDELEAENRRLRECLEVRDERERAGTD